MTDNKSALIAIDTYYKGILDQQEGLAFSFKKEGEAIKFGLFRGKIAKFFLKEGGVPEGAVLEDAINAEGAAFFRPYFERAWKGEKVEFKGEFGDKSISCTLTPRKSDEKTIEVTGVLFDMTKYVSDLQNAEQVQKEKTRFWRQANHEVRTPLNSIVWVSSLLSSTSLEEQQREYVKIIQDSIQKLAVVMDDILYFSKIGADQYQFSKKSFNLEDALHMIVDSLSFEAEKQNIEMTLNIPEKFQSLVTGDQEKIQQVAQNLLQAALDGLKQNGNVDLEIQSLGLDSEHAQKYHMLLKGNKKDGDKEEIDMTELGGVQFGIAAHLIRLMNGKITQKRPSPTSFEMDVEFSLDADQTLPKTNGIKPQLSSYRILFSLEAEKLQPDIKEMLQRYGASFAFEDDEYNVYNKLQIRHKAKSPYLFLVIDDANPKLNIANLIKTVRKDAILERLKIIVCLSKENMVHHQIYTKVGADTILEKPIHPSVFFNTLKDLCPTEEIVLSQKREADTVEEKKIWANILVVEDNKVNQMMAKAVLEKWGVTVFVADNGEEAVKRVQKENFDLILMDCQMPVMDGYDATVKIKSLYKEGELSVPIIALTAQTLKEDRQKCLAAGMDNFLGKPVSPIKLYNMLCLYLKHKAV